MSVFRFVHLANQSVAQHSEEYVGDWGDKDGDGAAGTASSSSSGGGKSGTAVVGNMWTTSQLAEYLRYDAFGSCRCWNVC